MNTQLQFIGHVNTPYNELADCPNNINPNGPLCQLVIDDDFKEGLSGLVPEQKILILYWLGDADRTSVLQKTHRDIMKGTFALRSPHRPNPIGAAVVGIESIEDDRVFVKGLDCLNGTKLLDIKPAILYEIN